MKNNPNSQSQVGLHTNYGILSIDVGAVDDDIDGTDAKGIIILSPSTKMVNIVISGEKKKEWKNLRFSQFL